MAKRKRGPAPRPTEEIRKTRVSVYFSLAELAELDRRRGGMDRSEWLRRAGLGKRAILPIPAINRDAWVALARTTANLNQLMRAIHAGQLLGIDLAVIEELYGQVVDLRWDLLGVSHLVDEEEDEA